MKAQQHTSGRYQHNPAYQEAVATLHQLLAEEGPGAVEQAFAEVAGPLRLKDCLAAGASLRLTPKDVRAWFGSEIVPLPTLDHLRFLVQDREVVRGVAQPYGLCWDTLAGLVDLCRERGLEAEIDAASSWHFPGRTILVQLRKVDTPR